MKKIFISYLLIALLFVANPGLIFAEEINSPEPEPQIQTEEVAKEEPFVVEDSLTVEEEEIIEETSMTSSMSFSSESSETINVILRLRYNDSLIFNDSVELIKNGTTTVSDNTGSEREIITNTALGALKQADITSDDFDISNLAYYASFDSFLINCLDVALSTGSEKINACYNWQYVVNDSYPYVGIDKYSLEDGDILYLYFGNPRIVELSTTTMLVGDSVTAAAKKYNYLDNTYEPLSDYVIGLTQPDPNNPWSPAVLFATSSNSLGQAVFKIDVAGSYGIGLESDYYYPVYNINVLEAVATATTATTTSGGGGSGSNNENNLDIQKAIEFLISNQKPNGSFGSDLYTDWVAIALSGISGNNEAQNAIKNFIKSDKISGSVLTDFERRAMSLMSLGINPYTGTSVNYIQKIIDNFDGSQFGDKDLFNDDIFALFPLLNAGYSSNDKEISKAVAFIISKQSSNGGWESVDLTSAAIQALVLVDGLPNVQNALAKARVYLASQQENNGSFGNTFATLWAMQAISALGEDTDSWSKGGNTPLKYIITKQAGDGGLNSELDNNSRIWATSYLIPAYYKKTWNDLIKNFSKQVASVTASDSSSNNKKNETASTTIATVIENANNEIIDNEEILSLISPATVAEITGAEPLVLVEQNTNTEEQNNIEENPTSENSQNNNNLQANILGSVADSGLLEIVSNLIDTTLAGISIMWSFVVSLFKF